MNAFSKECPPSLKLPPTLRFGETRRSPKAEVGRRDLAEAGLVGFVKPAKAEASTEAGCSRSLGRHPARGAISRPEAACRRRDSGGGGAPRT